MLTGLFILWKLHILNKERIEMLERRIEHLEKDNKRLIEGHNLTVDDIENSFIFMNGLKAGQEINTARSARLRKRMQTVEKQVFGKDYRNTTEK